MAQERHTSSALVFLADTNACWRDSFLNDVVMEGASPSITSGTGRKGLDFNCLPKVQVLKTWSPDDGDAGMGWKLQEVRSLHSLLMQGIMGPPDSSCLSFPS